MISHQIHHVPQKVVRVLWHVNPVLGNDRETMAVAKL
jgi:hypothetical protein